MALTAEEFYNSPQGSSHTQESGQAGFSANLTHTFSDSFENTDPIAIKGSSVRPIALQEGQVLFEVAREVVGVESYKENTFSVVPSLPFLSQSVSEGEQRVATPSLGRAGFAKAERKISFIPSAKKNRMIPPRRIPGWRKKNGSRRPTQKRIRTTVVIGFFVAVVLLPDCASSSDFNGDNCFTCNHTDCKSLHSIYGEKDELLYQSPLQNDTRTECSRVDALSNSCLPCIDRSPVIIYCSRNITHIEVEGDHGNLEVWKECEQENTSSHGGISKGRGHFGLILAVGMYLLACKACRV
ncbi:uncharacterized protein LOC112143611 isoform X1 [Oryzias melastigma]|uniref:uncharacterized protein LOC112143611 isoform X1 n=1 Tax=Oryzias melastigma TaxID=30732 RepID=UPI00168D789C|nr:uncharacterized protein LOC112143611 isoform X1 [Oryzias melastigma]